MLKTLLETGELLAGHGVPANNMAAAPLTVDEPAATPTPAPGPYRPFLRSAE